MASAKMYVASFLVCAVAYVCAVPVEMMEDTEAPEARQFLGGGLGGLGGYGLGGFGGYGVRRFGGYGLGGYGGYGLGGLGGFFDEDPSAENDESMDDEMASHGKTLVIPGHMIRKLKIKLNSDAAVDNLNTEMGPASGSIDNLNSETTPASTENQKFRVISMPHSKFRKLAKHLAKTRWTNTANTDTDTDSKFRKLAKYMDKGQWSKTANIDTDTTDMSNEGNEQEVRVIRVPSTVFKMLKNRYQQDVHEALDQESLE